MLGALLRFASKVEGRRHHQIWVGLANVDAGVEAEEIHLSCRYCYLTDLQALCKLQQFLDISASAASGYIMAVWDAYAVAGNSRLASWAPAKGNASSIGLLR